MRARPLYIATTRDDVNRVLILMAREPVPIGPFPHPVAETADGGWLIFDERLLPTRPGEIYRIKGENAPRFAPSMPPFGLLDCEPAWRYCHLSVQFH